MTDEQPTLEEQTPDGPPAETVAEMREEAHEHSDEKAAEIEAAEPADDEGPTNDEEEEGDARVEVLMARVVTLEREAAARMEEATVARLAALADAPLPATTFADALLHLRRPFSPKAVRWKLQTVFKNYAGGIVVGYIDARLVIERLNAVWPWWEDTYEPAGNGAQRCTLTLFSPEDLGQALDGSLRVRRVDVGTGSGNDALKGSHSDAFKRAAVKFGVGVSVYAMKALTLNVGTGAHELRTRKKKVKVSKQGGGEEWREVDYPIMDERLEARLALGYERWCASRGIPLFGPILDHGDELGAGGLEDDSDDVDREAADAAHAAAEAPAPGPRLEDKRATQMIEALGALYEEVRQVAPRRMPPAVYRQRLEQAATTSHEALEKLYADMREIVKASAPSAPSAPGALSAEG